MFFIYAFCRQDRTKQDLVYKLIPGLKESKYLVVDIGCYEK